MLIVGLLSSAVMLTVGSTPQNKLRLQTQMFQQYSQRVFELAVLDSRMLAMQLTDSGEVRILQREEGRWQQLDKAALENIGLAKYQLADEVQWLLAVDDKRYSSSTSSRALMPHILFSPDGLVSSFELQLSMDSFPEALVTDAMFYAQVD